MKRLEILEATMLVSLDREFNLKGFKRSGRVFYRHYPMGVQMFYMSLLRDEHDLSIIVDAAVRHDELERIFATVENITTENRTATIGSELGKLSGQKTIVWTFNAMSEVPLVGSQLSTKSWKVGQPFFETYSSLEKILDVLVDDEQLGTTLCSVPHVRAKKALVATCLLHRRELFDILIDSKTRYLQSIKSGNVPEFLEFAFKLKRLFTNS